jgi:hypothetical protein
MSYRYIFHPDAQQDYEEALIWYAEKSLLAAENFVTSVDQTLVLISNTRDAGEMNIRGSGN